eukprot:COSAG02_NODE_5224_length_4527_cov_18.072945_2_plen_132_part_00
MCHKDGRTWSERKSFRPISLLNDILKLFDGCLNYVITRETGIIQEPPPGEKECRPCYIPQTQRAFMRHRGAPDNIMLSALTKWRAQVCNLVVADTLTDLKGAFDACSHVGMDEALGEAGAGHKTRNLYRML